MTDYRCINISVTKSNLQAIFFLSVAIAMTRWQNSIYVNLKRGQVSRARCTTRAGRTSGCVTLRKSRGPRDPEKMRTFRGAWGPTPCCIRARFRIRIRSEGPRELHDRRGTYVWASMISRIRPKALFSKA